VHNCPNVEKPREAVFSEKEAADIVRLAVEMQESHTELASAYTPGITLDELKRVSAEIGVSEHFLEEALKRKGKAPANPQADPFKGTYEKVLDGELDPDDFDLLLDEFKTIPNVPGPNQVGRRLNAKTMVGIAQAEVTITSRNGRTRLRIDYIKNMGCVFLAIPLAFFGFIAVMVAAESALPWIGLVFFLGLIFSSVRGLSKANRYVDGQVEQLGDRLAAKIEAAIEQGSNPALPPVVAEGESQNQRA
jgi:hypothetical protein